MEKKEEKKKKIPIAVVIKPLYIWSGMRNLPTIKRQKRIPLMFKECLKKYFYIYVYLCLTSRQTV